MELLEDFQEAQTVHRAWADNVTNHQVEPAMLRHCQCLAARGSLCNPNAHDLLQYHLHHCSVARLVIHEQNPGSLVLTPAAPLQPLMVGRAPLRNLCPAVHSKAVKAFAASTIKKPFPSHRAHQLRPRRSAAICPGGFRQLGNESGDHTP